MQILLILYRCLLNGYGGLAGTGYVCKVARGVSKARAAYSNGMKLFCLIFEVRWFSEF